MHLLGIWSWCASPNALATRTQAIEETLRAREYALLPPRHKLAIMRALIHMALASDVLREHINARVEMFAVKAQLLAGKPTCRLTGPLNRRTKPP
jgi:hypothetical protein